MKRLFATAAIVLATLSAAHAATECKVTLEQYQKLEVGTNIFRAYVDIGCSSEELSEAELGKGVTMRMESWTGTALGSSMLITVINNEIKAKAQFGLK